MRVTHETAGAGPAAWLVFVATLAAYLSTVGGSLTSTDAVVTYNLTESLVERRSIALATGGAGYEIGRDGRMYSWFGLGQSVYNIPFYLAGRTARDALGLTFGKPDTIPKAVVATGSAVAAAGCVAVLFLFAWRLTGVLGPSLLAAFALAFGTILWPYARFGFNLPLAALLLFGGTYHVWRGTREASTMRLVVGGFLLGSAFLTRHELSIPIVPLLAWVAYESWPDARRLVSNLGTVGVPLVAALTVWLAYNEIRFGHPLDSGQAIGGLPFIHTARPPFTTFGQSFGQGIAGLLFAPGASAFLYSPILVVCLASFGLMAARDRSTTALVAAQVLLLLMFLAALGSWPAGRSYGSRYLVTVMPFMCLPLAYLFRDAGRTARRVGMAMLAVSVLMQLPGVLVDFSKVEQAQARQDDGQSAKARLWLWPEADFIANSRAAFRQVPENLRYLAGVEDPPVVARTAGTEERGFAQQFAFSLDFWWLYLFYLGAVSAPVALLGLIVPATISAICAWKLFALVRDAGHGEQGVTVASG